MNARPNRIPPVAADATGIDLVNAINNRMARLQLLATQAATAAPTPASPGAPAPGGTVPPSSSAPAGLMFTVSGTLATSSSAAPLAMLAAAAQPSSLLVILKKPPAGGTLQVTLSTAAAKPAVIGSVTIKDGAAQASAAGGLGQIPANTALVLGLNCGALAFPGSDLTLIVWF